ncbi:atexpb2, expb2, athexp beta 1.4 atexpb2 (expansin b2) [Musa troglodytarum]|uniref:Atexpb2, expb2, athexp beta 1.4 atexpb2 (Expansin b2) n=1 Tax=Musa troglodytarum TaxID=320322 RepID=A0A9E7JP82_9LILI|nr:atexpb2, expb2, athexp beta 1.4 atexpb2 (expansin b2) [Musa troglodytarum]
MSFSLRHPSSLLIFIALFGFLSLFRPCACSSRNFLNTSAAVLGASPAEATWYGSAHGAGSDGNVSNMPVFTDQVSCTSNAACSGNPGTLVITDECPGSPCASGAVYFDLSETAFWAMAKPGQEETLRAAGAIQVQFSTGENPNP